VRGAGGGVWGGIPNFPPTGAGKSILDKKQYPTDEGGPIFWLTGGARMEMGPGDVIFRSGGPNRKGTGDPNHTPGQFSPPNPGPQGARIGVV